MPATICLIIQMWVVLEATIETTTTQDIIAYHTFNHKLAITTGQWSTVPISRDTRICHFFPYYAIENKSQFVLECPLCVVQASIPNQDPIGNL